MFRKIDSNISLRLQQITEEIDRNVETSLTILFSRFHFYRYSYGKKLIRWSNPRKTQLPSFILIGNHGTIASTF